MRWWRRWPLAFVATVSGALLGVPAVLAAAGVRDWRVLAAGAAAAAVVSAFSQVERDRWLRARLRRDDQVIAIAEGCLGNPDGTLKAVRDFPDPVRLGVHEAVRVPSPDSQGFADHVPDYVPRDVDDELREQLSSAGFVLVTGPSAAGKSRTAYEAMRAAVPDHQLIAPDSRKFFAAALARFEQERKCVLWLDDLERFIGPDGLTRAAIGRALDGRGHHRLIVATMRDGEMERHAPDDAGLLNRELQRGVRNAIEQAWKADIRSTFSAPEVARARDSADPRIARALARANDYGVTRYLAAAPRLLRAWRSGWEQSPKGAALVAAAVDCRRAGLTGPLPRPLLQELHRVYLDRHPTIRTRPETLRAAWGWATTPPDEAIVPLLRRMGQSGYTVFDYLVDSAHRHVTADDLIPREVLARALRYADPAEAQSIGWTAMSQGCGGVALQAFRLACDALTESLGAEHPETLRIRANLAHAQYACGRLDEAKEGLHSTIASCERVLDCHAQLTLTARICLCYLLTDAGALAEAEMEYRFVLGVLHPGDDLQAIAKNGLAILYTNLGRNAEAEEEFRQVIAVTSARYGDDYIDTLAARCYRALALEQMDRLDEAQAEQEDVLASLEAKWGLEHFLTLQSRSNLAAVMRKQGRLEESRQSYTRVLEIRTRVLGAEHVATLEGYGCLAAVLAEQGRLREALAAYRALGAAYARTFGALHPKTIEIHHALAEILKKTG
jgi:tetratricopeptide (TPR) repeat protein